MKDFELKKKDGGGYSLITGGIDLFQKIPVESASVNELDPSVVDFVVFGKHDAYEYYIDIDTMHINVKFLINKSDEPFRKLYSDDMYPKYDTIPYFWKFFPKVIVHRYYRKKRFPSDLYELFNKPFENYDYPIEVRVWDIAKSEFVGPVFDYLTGRDDPFEEVENFLLTDSSVPEDVRKAITKANELNKKEKEVKERLAEFERLASEAKDVDAQKNELTEKMFKMYEDLQNEVAKINADKEDFKKNNDASVEDALTYQAGLIDELKKRM